MKQEVTVQASPEFMLDLASKTIVAQAAEIERLKESLHALTYWDNGKLEFNEARRLLKGWESKQ